VKLVHRWPGFRVVEVPDSFRLGHTVRRIDATAGLTVDGVQRWETLDASGVLHVSDLQRLVDELAQGEPFKHACVD
jgi:hypothetical protein